LQCGVREEPKQELVLGIIDYIRSYTLDKRVENRIKTLIEGADPTVLPPQDYRLRFLSAVHRYFILAPNRPCG
jgi:1-phosphatidylinositol-3-phosphate 5-kinase